MLNTGRADLQGCGSTSFLLGAADTFPSVAVMYDTQSNALPLGLSTNNGLLQSMLSCDLYLHSCER